MKPPKNVLKVALIPAATFGLVAVSMGTASASTTYGFDDSDPAIELTSPISIDGGALDLTSNNAARISGDIHNGDYGGWSIEAHSDPNVLKIWDNVNIALAEPADGFEIYCTTGDWSPEITTLTITTYFDGAVVDGPITQTLGALNEWELVSVESPSQIDEIEIVGRDSTNSIMPFGCDDLSLIRPEAATTTAAPTSTVASEDTLVKTGSNGAHNGAWALMIASLGVVLAVGSRRRAMR